jgi:hypothetical protein
LAGFRVNSRVDYVHTSIVCGCSTSPIIHILSNVFIFGALKRDGWKKTVEEAKA